MQTKFTWEGFENREFCVDFKNDADKMEFLRECEKRGYMWTSGEKATQINSEGTFFTLRDKCILKMGKVLPVSIYNSHLIDCSIAENYIPEHERLCTENMNDCDTCPLGSKTGTQDCDTWGADHPKEAIEIVQAWSDEHPIEPVVTYLDKLLEVFPSVQLNQRGTPCRICPDDIGLTPLTCKTFDSELCTTCWSQPYKGE